MSTPQPVPPVPAARPDAVASSEPAGRSGPVPASTGTEPFVSLHTAVVLLAAAVIGLVIATLTVLSGAHPATAAVAGLTAAGAGTTVLRTLIR
ncbi:hypothetical protein ACIOKD_38075 [Streptomyces sp. NPDC087844]|uniref:hypothetical protein n=1 Tax=Streptomyces sp. NPDC087844 TaxID=3365805 RepID=UPI00382BF452